MYMRSRTNELADAFAAQVRITNELVKSTRERGEHWDKEKKP
jgi:hypothetical protein